MNSNQLIEKLNQNVADLHVLYVKLHNFHWNIQGPQFLQIHNLTEEYYEHIAGLFDDVAERILQLGSKPLSTTKDYLQVAKISENNSTSFSTSDVLNSVIEDFKYLLKEYKIILNASDELGDTATSDLASGNIVWLEKELWMLNSSKG